MGTIIIELTNEDGVGTLLMRDELQLYRLYEKLGEIFQPRVPETIPENNLPQEPTTIQDPQWTRQFATEFSTFAVPTALSGRPVFSREIFQEGQERMENAQIPVYPVEERFFQRNYPETLRGEFTPAFFNPQWLSAQQIHDIQEAANDEILRMISISQTINPSVTKTEKTEEESVLDFIKRN